MEAERSRWWSGEVILGEIDSAWMAAFRQAKRGPRARLAVFCRSLLTKDVGGVTLADFQYAYDTHGRMTVKNEDGVVTTYSYDTTDQLTGEDFASGTDGAYSFDANGNRDMAGYSTGADNQLLSDGVWNYSYDAEGNMTGKEQVAGDVVWSYGYDPRNQLVKAERKSNGTDIDLRVEYTYDAWGSRVQKSVDADGDGSGPADLTKFVLDGWNPAKSAPIGLENFDVRADLNADGSLKTYYLRGDRVDEILARIDATGDHPGSYWYLTDHQGSLRKVLDATGTVVNTITYDAYGNILTETDETYRGRYTWTGRETEVEIEMQFNRGRYYIPSIGRWASKDPLGFDAGDSNLYRYAANAPATHSDPSGLFIDDTDLPPGVQNDISNGIDPFPNPPVARKVPHCPISGADITLALQNGLKAVGVRYSKLNATQKADLADSLYDINSGAAFSWDIVNLIGQNPSKTGIVKGDETASTAVVSERVYYTPSINYVLFGRVSRLLSDDGVRVWARGGGRPASISKAWMTRTVSSYRFVKNLMDGYGVEGPTSWAVAGWENDLAMAKGDVATIRRNVRIYGGDLNFVAGRSLWAWDGGQPTAIIDVSGGKK